MNDEEKETGSLKRYIMDPFFMVRMDENMWLVSNGKFKEFS